MIPHHHNPPSTHNKEHAAKPGENGLKWLKMGENGCHILNAQEAQNPVMEQQTCEKGPKLGFKGLPTYKTLHCVRTAWALRARHSLCPESSQTLTRDTRDVSMAFHNS